jgi:hypothetical protein
MSHDFKSYINVRQSDERIKRAAQKLKQEYSSAGHSTSNYLHALFEFFLKDIKNVANEIYSQMHHAKRRDGLKFDALSLSKCIQSSADHFMDVYDRIINDYNIGGIFRDYDKFERDRDSFKQDARQLFIQQSESHSLEYVQSLKKESREKRTYIAAVIGAVATVVGIIIAMIPFGSMLFSVKPAITEGNINMPLMVAYVKPVISKFDLNYI